MKKLIFILFAGLILASCAGVPEAVDETRAIVAFELDIRVPVYPSSGGSLFKQRISFFLENLTFEKMVYKDVRVPFKGRFLFLYNVPEGNYRFKKILHHWEHTLVYDLPEPIGTKTFVFSNTDFSYLDDRAKRVLPRFPVKRNTFLYLGRLIIEPGDTRLVTDVDSSADLEAIITEKAIGEIWPGIDFNLFTPKE